MHIIKYALEKNFLQAWILSFDDKITNGGIKIYFEIQNRHASICFSYVDVYYLLVLLDWCSDCYLTFS